MIASPNALAGVSLAHQGLSHPLMADAPGGRTLPVIDVTHPAFALDEGDDAMARLRRRADELLVQQKSAPKFVINAFMWFAAHRSVLFRTFTKPSDAYLDCLTTYVLKLGPENLVPPYSSWFDRYVVNLPPVISIRLRLQQTARLLAEGLGTSIAARSDAPLHLLNIGGGPASDSLNALILLRRDHPQALEKRVIGIHILDPDPEGPAFAKSSLAALQDNGPLTGLNVNINHIAYDWRDTEPLTDLLSSLKSGDPVIAASSEGALFEYGSDEDVIANLSAFKAAAPQFRFIVGSVTRNDEFSQSNLSFANYRLYPRGADGAGQLAAQAGFVIDGAAEALLSDQVQMTPGG